jgi:hypothetical protein
MLKGVHEFKELQEFRRGARRALDQGRPGQKQVSSSELLQLLELLNS